MKKRILTLGMVLTLVAVLVAPNAVLAVTTEVTGTVAHGYTFTAPTEIALGDMVPGAADIDNSAGWLEGNNALGYTVKGIDANTEVTKGKMLIVGGGSLAAPDKILTNKLYMGPDVDVAYAADTETTFLTTDGITDEYVPFYVSQTVEFTDPIATGYTITITFTVTQNT